MTLRDFDTIRFYDALITERQGPEVGLPEEITYSAVAADTLDQIAVEAIAPTRRVSDGARIIAAHPGDWCKLVMRGGNLYLFVAEGIKFKACPVAPGGDSTLSFFRRIFG